MKTAYVRFAGALEAALRALRMMELLDRWSKRSRTGVWIRSLFAIYDVEALVELDLPWWTFASADLVEQHLRARPGARVFEWGSGASTVWLARRAVHVTSIEHDPDWAIDLKPLLSANCRVLTVEPAPDKYGRGIGSGKRGYADLDFTEYVRAIDASLQKFDLIIIDGRAREACLRPALDHLADGGLIVFDNVDRRRYRDAIASVGGIEALWTRGLTPGLPYPTRTALIRRRVRR